MTDPFQDAGQLFVASIWANTFVGGDGVDTISFGDLKADLRSLGTYMAKEIDAEGQYHGRFGTIVYRDIERFIGSPHDDFLAGDAGPNTILGGGGDDTIVDRMDAGNVMRGGDGDDYVGGGQAHDDLNGNVGNDTVQGREGDDWVLGGQGNDLLYADEGADFAQGNLGNDTLYGGRGADSMCGGQGADLLLGEDGDDWLSGDRGDDTLQGGAGADTFRLAAEGGRDQVLDFSAAEGDRIRLDPGARFTATQVAGDTVISLDGAAQLILVGVEASGLPAGSVFVA